MPGAIVSATTVELNRTLLGTVPESESAVSQGGRVEASTVKNGAGLEAEVMLTSTLPAVPEPFT